ncbi:MAG TPA: helix-turn-helix domain-containing protein [Candidatus Woesebacteria bacterium]|nr:helix-turn-helix domain-containing protein [Candidatus Woesebacteria bacterium]
MEQKPVYYTIEEVAEILKVNPESVRRWVRAKKIPAIKLGGKYIRISATDLENFTKSSKVYF